MDLITCPKKNTPKNKANDCFILIASLPKEVTLLREYLIQRKALIRDIAEVR